MQKDLTGQRIGKLVMIERRDDPNDVHWAWLCKCDCGKEKVISSKDLIRKNPTVSCGCAKIRSVIRIGNVFGRWTVIEKRGSAFICRCECGTTRYITEKKIFNGTALACKECLDKDFVKMKIGERSGKLVIIDRDENRDWICRCDCGDERTVKWGSFKNGTFKGCKCNPYISNHPAANIYHGIMARCYHSTESSYWNYGARGIRIFREWYGHPEKFCKWIDENLGERPPGYSLDRIDNDGNYEPGNLRWADAYIQNNNKRNAIVARQKRGRLTIAMLECLSILHGATQKISQKIKNV